MTSCLSYRGRIRNSTTSMSLQSAPQFFLRATHWRDGLLFDLCASILEALWVLIISSISLMVLSIRFGLNSVGVDFIGAFLITFSSTLHPTEVIIYVTGILSSTTAYFLVRIRLLRSHIVRLALIFLVTAAIFLLATPLFIAGLDSPPRNEGFATTLAVFLALAALVVWIFSLLSQRRIIEKGSIPISGDLRGREIAKNIEGS